MATPAEKTLHRAGISTDGWDRLEDVLDEYLRSSTPGQSLVSNGDGTSAVWSFPYSGNGAFFAPPAAPDTWNDEFQDGTPILADRGLLVYRVDTNPPLLLTRAGDVDLNLAVRSGIPNGVYRSTIHAGRLLFQAGQGGNYFIGKESSGAYVHQVSIANTQVTGNTSGGLIQLANLTSAFNNAANTSLINQYSGAQVQFQIVDASTATSYQQTALAETIAQGIVYTTDIKAGLVSADFVAANLDSAVVRANIYAQAIAPTFPLSYAGIYWRMFDDNKNSCAVIDFLRRYPTTTPYFTI